MSKVALVEAISGVLVLAMVVILVTQFPKLPSLVPFFYTLPWGELQLANKYLLFTLPSLGLILLLFNLFFRTWAAETKYLSLGVAILLLASEIKIISSVSSLWPHAFIDFKNIGLPLIIAGLCSWLLSKPVIAFAKKFGFVDDPATHQHPAMLLKKPTPRAGGLAFAGAFLLTMLIIVPIDQIPWGIVFALLLYTVLGLIDDKHDINPYVRFGVLAFGAAVVAISGVGLKFFGTPFGIVHLDTLSVNLPQFLGGPTFIITDIFTVIWILWVSNLLSWSNGIDGQFSGVAGLTALFIAILALRLIPGDHNQIQTARIAAIAAGAALGLTPATWNPCKMLWGFGATAVGLVLASLSVMTGSKVATATLVVMVPFLDAVATIIRRVSLKKSPFWGDRGHLHHKLLDAGYTQPQIASLYWVATAILGVVAVFTSGQIKTLAVMTLGILVASMVVLTNLKGKIKIPRLLRKASEDPKAV